MEAKTFHPTQRMTEVNKLLDGLLAEPFAASQKIEDATLESIQASFEEIDEAYSEGAPPPELADLRDSYDRSKELFCMILMELEAMGATGNETLHELRHRDTGTQFITAQLESSRTPAPPPAPVAAPTLTLVPPPAEEEVAAETAAPAPNKNWEEAESLWDTHSEADQTLNKKPKSKFNPLPTPSFLKPAPATTPEVVAEAAAPVEAEDRDEVTVLKYIEEKKVVAPEPPPAPVANLSFEPKTEEYLAHAENFQTAGIERFEAQCRLFAVECELWARLRACIQLFWPKKEGAIREILDSGNKRFDFHPVLKKGLEGLAKEGKEFLPHGGLPYPSVLNSVRFFLSSPLWDSFWPLPVELGMLMLFFGGERTMRGLVLRNHLQLSGLTQEENLELAFRLFRCQIARNRTLAPVGATPDLETVREDSARILELAKKLVSGRPSHARE